MIYRVEMVAYCRLCNLFAKNVGMVEQRQVNLTLSLYCRLQTPRANAMRFSCNMHLSAECGLVFYHDPWKSDHSVTTSQGDFNRIAVFCDAKQRDNSAGDKPGVINRGADIKNNTACFEAESLAHDRHL
jgi:hypothetical protein